MDEVKSERTKKRGMNGNLTIYEREKEREREKGKGGEFVAFGPDSTSVNAAGLRGRLGGHIEGARST